eukprot:2016027-Pyramimonas_sp.AAC.1
MPMGAAQKPPLPRRRRGAAPARRSPPDRASKPLESAEGPGTLRQALGPPPAAPWCRGHAHSPGRRHDVRSTVRLEPYAITRLRTEKPLVPLTHRPLEAAHMGHHVR